MLCLRLNPFSCIDMPSGRNLKWGTRPQDVIDEAKANALAALVLDSPKLTHLEQAFYDTFKKRKL